MAFVALYLLFRAPYVASVKPIPDCKFHVLQRRGLVLGACSRDFGRHRLPAQYKRQLSALVHVMGQKQTAPKLAIYMVVYTDVRPTIYGGRPFGATGLSVNLLTSYPVLGPLT